MSLHAGEADPHRLPGSIPEIDFETFSKAGSLFTHEGKWVSVNGPGKLKGLPVVGAWCYAEHPSTEVMILCYDMKDGVGVRRWVPGQHPPSILFAHIVAGGLVEAHNSFFEFAIWFNVCTPRMGWPTLPLAQMRCSMAKARAHGLPGKLDTAAKAAGTPLKDAAGHAIMLKLSQPRKPTKKDPSLRFTPQMVPDRFEKCYLYCEQDIRSEAGLSAACPTLPSDELNLWLLDQRINVRGVACDNKLVLDAIAVLQQAEAKYNAELAVITGGVVTGATKTIVMKAWLESRGVQMVDMKAETVEEALMLDLPSDCHRVLKIRALLGGAAVKKLYAMRNQSGRDGRIRDIFQFCGAERTGRFSARGVQFQNMVGGFNPEVVDALAIIFTYQRLDMIEALCGDPIDTIAGMLRGALIAAPGHDLICSDFSAIEAVILAVLSGCQWRIDVFNTHGKIYEKTAAMITGIPFEEILDHKTRTGSHHPKRKPFGKIPELASGYGGWIGAWHRFGADEFMTDPDIKDAILSWRAASPEIPEFWGGQWRKHPDRWEWWPERYGLEGSAVTAIERPGEWFGPYVVHDDKMYCLLPSGRFLTYHKPRLMAVTSKAGNAEWQITFMGLNLNKQWDRLSTYGGSLAENYIQATARDIQGYAMVNLDRAGYPIVIHVHDEDVAEVPQGFGSVEEFETIMSTMPPWASGWPVKASGGWRGKRYRKD